MRIYAVVWSCVGLLLFAGSAAAQRVSSVVLGFGIDPSTPAWPEASWHDEVSEIYQAWREYLLLDPLPPDRAQRWSSVEQNDWIAYDLTSGNAYQASSATVVDIRPAQTQGSADEFVVRTLFTSAVGPERVVRPFALTRVYAVREDGRWVFGNALPRLTRDWERAEVGPITYVYEPGHAFDRARAERAVAFADSLAVSLDLPGIDELTYYIAGGSEEIDRIMGVDWTFGDVGKGYSIPWNRLLFSGDPVFGEEHRHELVHHILGPLLAEGVVHGMVNEGLATWLGGGLGMTFLESVRVYESYLEDHPQVTLDYVLAPNPGPDPGFRPAGAVLAFMIHEHGGVQALKELLRSGQSNDDLRATVVRIFGIPWPEVAVRWRDRVRDLALAQDSL